MSPVAPSTQTHALRALTPHACAPVPRLIEAVLHLAPKPDGFTAGELAVTTGELLRQPTYTPRHAAHDLRTLRRKGLIAGRARPAP